jgi:hypothetical protein
MLFGLSRHEQKAKAYRASDEESPAQHIKRYLDSPVAAETHPLTSQHLLRRNAYTEYRTFVCDIAPLNTSLEIST